MGNQNAGRPPGQGERFPSGDLKPDIAPAELARVRAAVLRGVLDAKFGSQVGMLLMAGKLTSQQAAAAFRFAEIYGRFESMNGLRRSTRSPSYESGISTASANKPIAGTDDDERRRAIEDQWIAVQDWLEDYSKAERAQLEALCVEDIAISSFVLADIGKMLDRLHGFLAKGRGKKKRRKKKAAPALMLVTKDMRAAPKPATVRRADPDREAFVKVQRTLNPKLTDDQLNDAYGIFLALKDRHSFRSDKQR